VSLSEDTIYTIRIVGPDELIRSNPEIVGAECPEDITDTWYIVARGGGETLSIDCRSDRLGLCYDCSTAAMQIRIGSAMTLPVTATRMLVQRALSAKVTEPASRARWDCGSTSERRATSQESTSCRTRVTGTDNQEDRAVPVMWKMPQDLLAYLSADFTETDVEALLRLVESLGSQGPWSRAAPQFVDETDDSSCSLPEDEPVRTVGLLLSVSAEGEDPPTPVEEPTRIVEALAKFSAERGVEFEVQIDHTYCGAIEGGVPDKSIREGLLAPW
jgi:hypothetical protein